MTAITFVVWGVSNQHLALLRRTMQFGTIARIQLSGTLVGIVVAILMAVCGYGYWALVLRPIASCALRCCRSVACSAAGGPVSLSLTMK